MKASEATKIANEVTSRHEYIYDIIRKAAERGQYSIDFWVPFVDKNLIKELQAQGYTMTYTFGNDGLITTISWGSK